MCSFTGRVEAQTVIPVFFTFFLKQGKPIGCPEMGITEHSSGLSLTWASKAVSGETLWAGASVWARGVDALSIYAALVGSIRALVQICVRSQPDKEDQQGRWDILMQGEGGTCKSVSQPKPVLF